MLAALVTTACGGGTTAPTVDGNSAFLAFSSTFQPFRTWTSVHSDGPPAGAYPDHPDVLGPRTQYINELPPAGATEFPIGTVIVEARESSGMRIFAAVKRGGGFNVAGATNWEYFELREDTGSVVIAWRGIGPPLGDTYGGDPDGCNSCHTVCGAGNDFICSPKLQLKDL
jgi:hypothetical protein